MYDRLYNPNKWRAERLSPLLEIKQSNIDFCRYCLLALVKFYDRVKIWAPSTRVKDAFVFWSFSLISLCPNCVSISGFQTPFLILAIFFNSKVFPRSRSSVTIARSFEKTLQRISNVLRSLLPLIVKILQYGPNNYNGFVTAVLHTLR